MNNIDLICDIYKPLKVDKRNNCIFLDTMDGRLVIKTNSKIDYGYLYKYLRSRGFNYLPDLIDVRDSDVIFRYQEDVVLDINQKAVDLIKVVGLLHSKTSYFKDVSNEMFLNIFNNLHNNALYMETILNNHFDTFILEENIIPSHNLFLNNFSIFYGAVKCLKDFVQKWYLNVKDLTRVRVSVNHNNLSLDHFIKNESDYLISWDKYVIDTPVLDFVNFYKKEWGRLEFSQIYKIYNEVFHLLDDEKMLLCILLLDIDISFEGKEYSNCLNIRNNINYLNKTYELFKLIWPEEFK